MHGNDEQTRRTFLVSGTAAGLTLALPTLATGQQLPLTPECRSATEVTIRQTEGPFFKPKSPMRTDLREPAFKGELLVITGLVLSKSCKPVPNALVDLWHADGGGEYDNKGFRGRGHQFTDNDGRYNFITVKPGRYPGRTPHYHVNVQAANRPVLTTQLYFPDDPGNARDGIFRKELLMRFVGDRTPPVARFDFVLDIA
jgi:protocatechuate 3,4-dioxygenase beta subunit